MREQELKLKLEKLRIEFIKRGINKKDPETESTLFRAEISFLEQVIEPVNITDIIIKNGIYSANIEINAFADIEDIKKSIEHVIISKIAHHKKLLALDCPESIKPVYNTGRGQFSPINQYKEIILCLNIYDLIVSGKTWQEIASDIYENQNQSHHEKNRWHVDIQKVRNHYDKALLFIQSAQSGTFPDLKKLTSDKSKSA